MGWVTRGDEHHYYYPNDQLALTMWYHDHVMTRTRVNVYAGLAGAHSITHHKERLHSHDRLVGTKRLLPSTRQQRKEARIATRPV